MTGKHPCAGKVDDALHHPDGSHRTTPRFATGRLLDRHESALRKHLAAVEEFEADLADYPHLTHAERLTNSKSGNPRWLLNITKGADPGAEGAVTTVCRTAPDIADAYGVEELLGCPIEYELTDGRVTRIRKAGR